MVLREPPVSGAARLDPNVNAQSGEKAGDVAPAFTLKAENRLERED
jgi:hypothetical protein